MLEGGMTATSVRTELWLAGQSAASTVHCGTSTSQRTDGKASTSLEFPKPTSMAAELENNDKGLFIHMKYHPLGISRQQIRTIFDEICNNFNDTAAKVERVTVPLSRPANLKDELISAKLYQPILTFSYIPVWSTFRKFSKCWTLKHEKRNPHFDRHNSIRHWRRKIKNCNACGVGWTC